jgi:hypothetical protein
MAAFIPLFLGGLQAIGSVVSGAEQSAQLKATEQTAKANAQMARDDATNELRIATADAEGQRRRGNRIVAEQATAFSQSGFGIADSAMDSLRISSSEAELDAMNVQYKGDLRARGLKSQANAYESEASAAKAARKTIPFKTAIGAATSLLSGYGKMQGARIS